jgi:hypothetical protein
MVFDKDTIYYIKLISGFTTLGVLINIFLSSSPSQDGMTGHATSTVWGYGVIIIALFALITILFSLASKEKKTASLDNFGFLKLLITTSFPTLITILISIWILTLNAVYYKKINEQKVAPEFYQFSIITTILIIGQLFTLFKPLLISQTDAKAGQSNTNQNKMQYATYIFAVFNMIFVGIMNIILALFSTDG